MTQSCIHTHKKILNYLLELSEIASGKVKFTITLENKKAIPYKLQHRVNKLFSNETPTKKNKNINPYQEHMCKYPWELYS